MPDKPAPSGLQYLVIDGYALEYYPPNVRKAAEVFMAYLHGLNAGRTLGSDGTKLIRKEVDKTSVVAAAAARNVGNLSACGGIYGVTGSGSGAPAPGSAGSFVLVWGPDAANVISKLP